MDGDFACSSKLRSQGRRRNFSVDDMWDEAVEYDSKYSLREGGCIGRRWKMI
jgi:hypothetical protein